MTFCTNNPSSCGIVELDNKGVVIESHEKVSNPPVDLANCVIYILSSEFIKDSCKNFRYATEFTTQILAYHKGRIYTYETKDFFYGYKNFRSIFVNQ